MGDDEVFSFVASSIPSVWALELLFLLKRNAPNGRQVNDLVRELRSSTTAVSDALRRLNSAGLVISESGVHYYRPVSPALENLVSEAERLYALKPVSVIKAIVTVGNEALEIFANSFKLKE